MTNHDNPQVNSDILPPPPPMPPPTSFGERDEEAKKVDLSRTSSQAGLQTFIHAGNIIYR